MQDDSIMTVLTFAGAIIAVIAPIIRLNVNITKLNTNFENMMKNDEVRDHRISKHGKEIENIERVVDRHELRIQVLEDRNNIKIGE